MLCTGLWIACADTPPPLCAVWGWRCGYCTSVHRENAPACGYAVHGLCAGKTFGPGGRPQWSEVIHIRNFTYDVTCAVLRSRPGRSPGQLAQRIDVPAGFISAGFIHAAHRYIDSLGSPGSGQQGSAGGRRRLGVGPGGCARLPGGRSPASLAFEHVFDERGTARPDLPGYRRACWPLGQLRSCGERGAGSRCWRGRRCSGGSRAPDRSGRPGGSPMPGRSGRPGRSDAPGRSARRGRSDAPGRTGRR
jgi:hypothetical protein